MIISANSTSSGSHDTYWQQESIQADNNRFIHIYHLHKSKRTWFREPRSETVLLRKKKLHCNKGKIVAVIIIIIKRNANQWQKKWIELIGLLLCYWIVQIPFLKFQTFTWTNSWIQIYALEFYNTKFNQENNLHRTRIKTRQCFNKLMMILSSFNLFNFQLSRNLIWYNQDSGKYSLDLI